VNESTAGTLPDSEAGIRVVGTRLSASELAAVTAVLEAAVEEEFEELHSAVTTAPSAWERSQRQLRGELRPAAGAWRSFSAV
jgi:hypothetical protein